MQNFSNYIRAIKYYIEESHEGILRAFRDQNIILNDKVHEFDSSLSDWLGFPPEIMQYEMDIERNDYIVNQFGGFHLVLLINMFERCLSGMYKEKIDLTWNGEMNDKKRKELSYDKSKPTSYIYYKEIRKKKGYNEERTEALEKLWRDIEPNIPNRNHYAHSLIISDYTLHLLGIEAIKNNKNKALRIYSSKELDELANTIIQFLDLLEGDGFDDLDE